MESGAKPRDDLGGSEPARGTGRCGAPEAGGGCCAGGRGSARAPEGRAEAGQERDCLESRQRCCPTDDGPRQSRGGSWSPGENGALGRRCGQGGGCVAAGPGGFQVCEVGFRRGRHAGGWRCQAPRSAQSKRQGFVRVSAARAACPPRSHCAPTSRRPPLPARGDGQPLRPTRASWSSTPVPLSLIHI